MFISPWFAVAGLIAATGPVIIHLLNRRRFKIVQWAAMDFLREAVHRSRRILQLQDLLLLALRSLCILLFGLALARPIFTGSATVGDPDQPVHAVLLIDNSLSMGYQKLTGTVLAEAKARAGEFIDALPRGSRISVLPTCGSATGFSYDAYYSKEDAREALGRIEVVDRASRPHETLEMALEACRRVANPAAKQVVLFTDQQIVRWNFQGLKEYLEQIPGGLKIEQLRNEDVSNAWVADVQLRDGVADMDSPAHFLATVSYRGSQPRRDVKITLLVDGQPVAEQIVELQPGQDRQVEFQPYQFDLQAEPGKPNYVTVEVAIDPPDNLPTDDRRYLVVPVVASLPVVFVDQWGNDEDPRAERYGYTYFLRRLIAPVTAQTLREKQPLRIERRRLEELDRAVLEDARFVVIAGVPGPERATVLLLREYVEQGGNLLIAAGGDFDPHLWTETAWLDGLGILPVPLEPVIEGRIPGVDDGGGAAAEPFRLDFDSLKDRQYFISELESQRVLQEIYSDALFFRTVKADVSDQVRQQILRAVAEDIATRRRALEQINRQIEELTALELKGRLSPAQRQSLTNLEQERSRLAPNWLVWADPLHLFDQQRPAEELAEQSRPDVLARYTNGLPFMIERRIGRGKVVLVTSSVFPDWNIMPLTKASFVYARLLRQMLHDSLPVRNVSTHRQLLLPVTAAERVAQFIQSGPEGQEETLAVELIGEGRFGVVMRPQTQRGIYRVAAVRQRGAQQQGLEAKLWEVPVAVNGPAEESDIPTAEQLEMLKRLGQGVGAEGNPASVALVQTAVLQPGDLGWRLMIVVLIGLLIEQLLLAWSRLPGRWLLLAVWLALLASLLVPRIPLEWVLVGALCALLAQLALMSWPATGNETQSP